MDGTLIAPDADFCFIRTKSDTVDLCLIRATSQLADLLPGSSIPYANQCPSDGSGGKQSSGWGDSQGRNHSVVRNNDGMRVLWCCWWRPKRNGRRRANGNGWRTGRKMDKLDVSGLSRGHGK